MLGFLSTQKKGKPRPQVSHPKNQKRDLWETESFRYFEERDIPSWTGMVVTLNKHRGLITEIRVELCLAPRVQGKFS